MEIPVFLHQIEGMAMSGALLLVVGFGWLIKRRKGAMIAGMLAILIFAGFVFIRPAMVERVYEDHLSAVEQYLSENYPDESWSALLRKYGDPEGHVYEIAVTFDNEPGVTYIYDLEDGEVFQQSITSDREREFRHAE